MAKTKIKAALENTLKAVNSKDSPSGAASIHDFSSMGDGCVLISIWSRGSVIIFWDGRNHVDINLTIDESLIEFRV